MHVHSLCFESNTSVIAMAVIFLDLTTFLTCGSEIKSLANTTWAYHKAAEYPHPLSQDGWGAMQKAIHYPKLTESVQSQYLCFDTK